MTVQPNHLTLGELIERLKKEPPDKRIRLGFKHPHSYRGDYYDLAFETCESITVGEMLAAAEAAVGRTFEGWKGGDYTMDPYTDCWLAIQEGSSMGETIGAVLLDRLLADEIDADAPSGKCWSEMTTDEVEAWWAQRDAEDRPKEGERP